MITPLFIICILIIPPIVILGCLFSILYMVFEGAETGFAFYEEGYDGTALKFNNKLLIFF